MVSEGGEENSIYHPFTTTFNKYLSVLGRILLGLPKLEDEGSLEAEIYVHFSQFSDYPAVFQSHRLL